MIRIRPLARAVVPTIGRYVLGRAAWLLGLAEAVSLFTHK